MTKVYTDSEISGRYEVVGKLGNGTFGVVEVVKYLPTGALYARKSHHLFVQSPDPKGLWSLLLGLFQSSDDSEMEQAKRRTHREASNLEVLKGNPPVLHLYEYYQTPDGSGHIVTELCMGGNVYQLVRDNAEKDPERRFFRFRNAIDRILEGVVLLHANDIVHRDIKPNNILIRTPFDFDNIAIADFGLSKLLTDPNSITLSSYFSPPYSSPEQLVDFRTAREPADVYATAIVLAEVIVGRSVKSSLNKLYQFDLMQRPEQVQFLRSYGIMAAMEDLLGKVPSQILNPLLTAVNPDPSARRSIMWLRERLHEIK